MDTTSAVSALFGGALIGLAASVMLLFNGRIAGISGVYGGLLKPVAGDLGWRAAFVGGLVLSGLALALFAPSTLVAPANTSLAATGAAGLLVGLGVRLGNGCTSGHGVCGISRLSRRSIVATLAFMATGMATASFVQLWAGGAL